MKKILVISNMYPSPDHVSFGIFVKNQVKALEKAGISVEIAVNDNPKTGKKNTIVKYLKWGLTTLSKGFKLRKQLSVTHAHYVFPSGLLSLLLKRLFHIPYVVTAHGGDIERMAKKSAKIHHWTKQILENSAHVIAVGPVLAEQIEQDFGIPKEKISVFSMGVNREVFKPANKIEIRRELHLPEERFIFLFVGNVIKQKGIEELLQAFQMVKKKVNRPVELVLVGSRRDTDFINSLEHFIDDDVKFVDPVQQQELVKYFQASDVFVLPSHLEGFGLVALEALATGTPVIASHVGGLVSLLGNGAGKLVPPQEVSPLVEEMLNAMNTPLENYQDQQAIESILQVHDEKNITAQVISIYESAAKGGDSV